MTHQPCPLCGGRQPTYRLQAPTSEAWNSFLNAWLAGYGTAPVSTAQLVALATEHGVILAGASPMVQFGHLLGQLAKANAGPSSYAVRLHVRAKGRGKPTKWKLVQK
jgi:hypothetical protein